MTWMDVRKKWMARTCSSACLTSGKDFEPLPEELFYWLVSWTPGNHDDQSVIRTGVCRSEGGSDPDAGRQLKFGGFRALQILRGGSTLLVMLRQMRITGQQKTGNNISQVIAMHFCFGLHRDTMHYDTVHHVTMRSRVQASLRTATGHCDVTCSWMATFSFFKVLMYKQHYKVNSIPSTVMSMRTFLSIES